MDTTLAATATGATGAGPSEGSAAHLDVLAPGFRVDSEPVRAAAALHWYATTPLGPAVLRHADCVALLRDRRLHQGSSEHLAAQGISTGPVAEMWRGSVLCADGDRHTRLRRLVGRAFTPGAVDRIRPAMRGLVHELVDGFAADGQCEFMTAFANRYPPRVMFDLLGLGPEDHEAFLGYGEAFSHLLSFSVAEHEAEITAALFGLYEAVDRLAAHRRHRPTDDLLSRLVTVTDGDDRFTPQELRSMVVMLIFGGLDTTRNQLGYAVVTFSQHLDKWKLLAQRPELADPAVEEILRVNSAIPIIWRVAAEDFTYKDLDITAGTRLWMMVATAHQDEAVYGSREFDITAERPAQIGFGGGPHYCLGAALARAELAEALPILAARLPHIEIAGSVTYRPELEGIMGPLCLPIRFRPAPAQCRPHDRSGVVGTTQSRGGCPLA
jgi:cytochrome P450